MSSIMKLPFIFLVPIAMHISYTPPNPPAPKEERVALKENAIPVRAILNAKIVFWLVAVMEAATIIRDYLWPQENELGSLYLTPVSLGGLTLVVIGSYIRYWCYSAMGSMFTIEVSIRKDHQLIKHGPYRIVRHPSYMGAFLVALGGVLWYFSRGSFLRESVTLTSGILGAAVLSTFAFTILLAISRVDNEDYILRTKFGSEWVQWAQEVPYKIIPHLY